MEGLLLVLTLGGIMALASFLAGLLPLTFTLSHRQTRMLSSIGTGLLIGTALIVIIPEGIETMYAASTSSSAMTQAMQGVQTVQTSQSIGAIGAAKAAMSKVGQAMSEEMGRAAEIAGFSRRDEMANDHDHDHSHENVGASPHAWIGISLVTGFILMFLIDSSQISHGHSHKDMQAIPMTDLDSPASSIEDKTMLPTRSKSSTTIGLLIHSFADGIALGASAGQSTQTALGVVVFAAILVHKAPAAFGLTSVLLKQGFGKRAARAHLLAFSLAAPIGALVTWTLVTLLGGHGSVPAMDQTWWTGLVLVFSGGTFLYVAMHAMQEHSQVDIDTATAHSRSEVWLTVTGMLLPLLTQIGHAHAHPG